MAEELKHYRYGGNISHIGVEALPSGKDINVIIERIAWVDNEVVNGQKQSCWVGYFKPNPYFTLPMVLNSTNRKRIARLAGTPYLEPVKNLPVTLTKEMDRVYGGKKEDRDWGLRISQIAPKITPKGEVIKPTLTPESPNWGANVKWIQSGGDINKLWDKYDITPENKIIFLQKIEEVKE